MLILSAYPPPQRIVGKTPLTNVRQRFFEQLARTIPNKHMLTVVRIADRQQSTIFIKAIVAARAVGLGRIGEVEAVER